MISCRNFEQRSKNEVVEIQKAKHGDYLMGYYVPSVDTILRRGELPERRYRFFDYFYISKMNTVYKMHSFNCFVYYSTGDTIELAIENIELDSVANIPPFSSEQDTFKNGELTVFKNCIIFDKKKYTLRHNVSQINDSVLRTEKFPEIR
jgi:hypothetical protein